MAYLLNGTSDYFQSAAPPVTAYPFTVSLWVWLSGLPAAAVAPWFCGQNGATSNYFAIEVDTSGRPRAVVRNTTIYNATALSAMQPRTWHNIVAVFSSATLRTCYLDGTQAGTNTDNATPTTNSEAVGRMGDSTPSGYLNGAVAQMGIWNVALNANEVALLGLHRWAPPLVRLPNLVVYRPFTGIHIQDVNPNVGRTKFNIPLISASGVVEDPQRIVLRDMCFGSVVPSIVWPDFFPLWTAYGPSGGNRRRRVIICGGDAA